MKIFKTIIIAMLMNATLAQANPLELGDLLQAIEFEVVSIALDDDSNIGIQLGGVLEVKDELVYFEGEMNLQEDELTIRSAHLMVMGDVDDLSSGLTYVITENKILEESNEEVVFMENAASQLEDYCETGRQRISISPTPTPTSKISITPTPTPAPGQQDSISISPTPTPTGFGH